MSAASRLTESDLDLLKSALQELQAAQNVLNFVQAHVGKTYRLEEGDRVELDGAIVRAPKAYSSGVSIDR